jgi:hypothetical protein
LEAAHLYRIVNEGKPASGEKSQTLQWGQCAYLRKVSDADLYYNPENLQTVDMVNQNIGEYDGYNAFDWWPVLQSKIHAVATRPECSIPVAWPRGIREPAFRILTRQPHAVVDTPMVEIIHVFGVYDQAAHRIIPDSIKFCYPHLTNRIPGDWMDHHGTYIGFMPYMGSLASSSWCSYVEGVVPSVIEMLRGSEGVLHTILH